MWRMAAKRPDRLIPVVIYGLSMILLFLASGTFHGLYYDTPEQKRLFQTFDQTAIYLLIAGSYTPVISVLLVGGWWRRWLLRMVWGFAAAGVACLWLLPKAPHSLVVALYLGVGWAGFLALPMFYRALGWRPMNWVLVGAALYSAGAVCELTQWPKIVPGFGFHEVLHCCDSVASVVIFLFVVRYVIPYEAPPAAEEIPEPIPEVRICEDVPTGAAVR
jgi:hemolysin III